MNLDFHYYGTMTAALDAGFRMKDAARIARAAQFVDDCTVHVFHTGVDYEQIPTSRLTEDLIPECLNPTPYTDENVKKAREIWGNFHFLPGNQDGDVEFYGKRESGFFETTRWKFDASVFAKLCIPESRLAQSVIQDAIDREDTVVELERVGMYMHILADTWAHCGFAGLPDWSCNDVRQSMGLEEYLDGWHNVEVGLELPDNPDRRTYKVVKMISSRYISPLYLGHGQLGQMPDLGFLRFRYVPVWKEKLGKTERVLERNNT